MAIIGFRKLNFPNFPTRSADREEKKMKIPKETLSQNFFVYAKLRRTKRNIGCDEIILLPNEEEEKKAPIGVERRKQNH